MKLNEQNRTERNDNAGIKTQNHKSAEGQDDFMSLVIKNYVNFPGCLQEPERKTLIS